MDDAADLKEFHWMVDMLTSLDVGLIVLDKAYNIQVWNSFMGNHSGLDSHKVIGQNIFDLFGDIPVDWFKRKVDSVFLLNNRSFTTWEQRPYMFKFKNYRPITGSAEYMYQNITFLPINSVDGEINRIGIIIYDVTDIAVSKTELKAANEQLAELSRTDRLTGLNNRGYWEECLSREFRRSKRTGHSCSLIMFDIDHFKKVNDTYGHQVGDDVIRHAANIVRQCSRTTDIPGRYGGEEFCVILINTPQDGAFYFAERIRKCIEKEAVHSDGVDLNYTVSLGVSELTPDIGDYKRWLEYADQALYQSKRGGRNQTNCYQNDADSKRAVVK